MRTTLNLDEDVARQLAHMARAEGRSVSRVANQVLRAGLLAGRERSALAPYEAPFFDTGRPRLEVTDVAEAMERLDTA